MSLQQVMRPFKLNLYKVLKIVFITGLLVRFRAACHLKQIIHCNAMLYISKLLYYEHNYELVIAKFLAGFILV